MPLDRRRAAGPEALLADRFAAEAMGCGNDEAAWVHLNQVLTALMDHAPEPQRDAHLIETSLELAKVCFVLGKGFDDLTTFLTTALASADRVGDRRSAAMINLHLGRLYYFAEQRHTAVEAFARGKAAVEALGDEDIASNAAELIGLYYFIQGRFPEAMSYFERAAKSFEFGEQGHSGPLWLSYCAAFLGQYHRAIGTLDFYRRLAKERADFALATTLRSVLGIFLVRIRKTREAGYHLSGALQEAAQSQNILAGYFAMGGLAFHHMEEGRLEESNRWMVRAVQEGAKAGLIHQYASPFVLELLFAYHRNRMTPMANFNFTSECRRILNEPNIHLRGVALRLMALDEMDRGGRTSQDIAASLQESESLLQQSGDPVQLGKTRIAMARLHLGGGDTVAARRMAKMGWKGFSGYADAFYPDDLRGLLADAAAGLPAQEAREELLVMFTVMIRDLVPSDDPDDLLRQTVGATNRFFGAERGGIFWFGKPPARSAPTLRAACNLFQSDVDDDAFRASLTLVFKAYRENRPQIVRHASDASLPSQLRAMMAVPVVMEGTVRGVFYHDNAYVNDCFDRFTADQLMRMAQALSQYVGRMLRFTRRLEAQNQGRLSSMAALGEPEIVGTSLALQKVLDQADRIAGADSTVLILGDTGVGKELLARRIHHRSRRSEHPLVVVDPTVIPDTLVESELFGHEKGAFTGADRQKPGRIELAHNGTLFIDEVGEIPLATQAKLLRALQEKTVVRVGGTRTLVSNFRLIAATNRNLAEEVAAGRFREDLYYRINVIPLELPPLRKRGDDVVLLARHTLAGFGEKYNRPALRLSAAHETALKAYRWPGNIRELENVMERAVLLSSEEALALSLPEGGYTPAADPFSDMPSLEEVQRRYIAYVLKQTNGKIAGSGGAAELLGMKRTSLYNRMKKLGMR